MAYPFAAAEVLTAVDLNAMIGAPTQNAQTGTTYTAVLLDAGKTVTLSNASAVTLTIPAQASVSWADNTQLNFLNIGAGTVTITPAAGVTINGEPLTLETSKGGSLVRTASNVWTFTPTGGGGGKVLQVVRAIDSTDRTTTSTSYVDASISVTITPTLSTSSILLIWSMAVRNASGDYIGVQITNASNVAVSGAEAALFGSGTAVSSPNSLITSFGYASPATTSAVTYKGRFTSIFGGLAKIQSASQNKSQLFAIEVAA